jgi:beta-glucosidase
MENEDITTRAKKILNEMSLEQKIGQIQCMFCGGSVPTAVLDKFQGGLGEIATTTCPAKREELLAEAKEEQRIIVEKCGVPALRHVEAVTGLLTADATVFPSAIGLGATWNPETVKCMADLIRRQMVSVGMRHALSPVMDVARDPRWGRVGETYGEDPTLCAAMSVAYTKGLQSEDLTQGAIATGKHFLGYSMSEGGLNMAVNPIPERELREVYAKPFQAAISEANLGAIMNSYGVIDGEMIIGSKNILHDLLREEMGFDGIIVSDYMSINKMVDLKISESPGSAGKQALKAGLDSELPMPYGFAEELLESVKVDNELEEYLDHAVLRILITKIKLGLFENPAAQETLTEEAYDKVTSQAYSLKAARESIVMLKNDGILPLQKDIEKLAVIGPHADSLRLLFGCYTYPAALDRDMTGAMKDMAGMEGISRNEKSPNETPYLPGSTIRASSPLVEEELKKLYGNKTLTIVEAIKEKCPATQVTFRKGSDVAGMDTSGFDEAVEAARNSDAVILVGGGKYGWGGNCTTGEGVDCDQIGLTGIQEKLAQEIYATGTPCIFVHLDAKPLSSEFIKKHFSAVLENWFPGDTGGKALADVLFGDYNPAGRLPMTVARNTGQIPIYASQKNGSGYHGGNGMVLCKYVEGSKEPLHYFGEGQSYTTFEYSDLRLSKAVDATGNVQVSCIVTNTGEMAGEEVVQVYITDELASMVRPAQELAGFYRVFLNTRESKRIYFEMRADQFAFLDSKMKWIVETGTMSVKVGASSKDIRLTGKFKITNTAYIDGKKRGFYAKSWETVKE